MHLCAVQRLMIEHREMNDWFYSQKAANKQSMNLTWSCLRESLLSHLHQQLFTSPHSFTKRATCEPRGVSLPPTQFILSLSLPEWTSTTPRWNNSLLAFQRTIEHRSKNKTEKEQAGLSGGPLTYACFAEKETAGTLCAPALLAWTKSTTSRQSTG